MEAAPTLPHALSADVQHGIARLLPDRTIIAFLDYDGTCTPIVRHPDDAVLTPEMAATLEMCCRAFQTVFVSGRAQAKVRDFVRIENAVYAGSHGFDMEGVFLGVPVKKDTAADARPALHFAKDVLTDRLKTIEGALVEDNVYSVSVHYRNVDAAEHARVAEIVSSVLQSPECEPHLVSRPGKMVIELRPKIAWNKGKAVRYLLEMAKDAGVLPNATVFALGDDITDEDTFNELNDLAKEWKAHGHDFDAINVFVTGAAADPAPHTPATEAKMPRATGAQYYLRSPEETRQFLLWLQRHAPPPTVAAAAAAALSSSSPAPA